MAERSPRPADMPWMTPYLTVRDIDAALAFYEKAFGFTVGMQFPGKDGRTMHADMRYHDQPFMLGRESDEPPYAQYRAPVSSGTACPMGLYVYVDDVDAAFKRAVDAGGKVGYAVMDMFWGDRCGQVIDPDGYNWTLATNVGEFDPSKVPAM